MYIRLFRVGLPFCTVPVREGTSWLLDLLEQVPWFWWKSSWITTSQNRYRCRHQLERPTWGDTTSPSFRPRTHRSCPPAPCCGQDHRGLPGRQCQRQTWQRWFTRTSMGTPRCITLVRKRGMRWRGCWSAMGLTERSISSCTTWLWTTCMFSMWTACFPQVANREEKTPLEMCSPGFARALKN